MEKRDIFLDPQDYRYFEKLLRAYLDPNYEKGVREWARKDLSGEVQLIAYCLMPNHFHLLLKQISDSGLEKLTRRVMTGYVMYFNQKYQRVGSLFQGRYKAAMVDNDYYLQHVCRYIHLNPTELGLDYRSYSYSNYFVFTNNTFLPWQNPKPVLESLDGYDYAKFVAEHHDTNEIIGSLRIEDSPQYLERTVLG